MTDEEHWRLWLTELRRWVKKCLTVKEVWQVHAHGEQWVCPYCAKILQSGGSADDDLHVDGVMEHLVDQCKAFSEIGVPPTLSVEALRTKALAHYVKKRLTTSASWQMRDATGHWICPYCSFASEVPIKGKLDKQTLAAIVHVVSECQEFVSKGHDGFFSVEEMRSEAAKRSNLQANIEELTSWMED